jgi:Flp pilus assembly pilin Flp
MYDTDNTNTSPADQSRIRCERGQALVEYALIIGLVSIVAFGLTPVGQWVSIRLGDLAAAL